MNHIDDLLQKYHLREGMVSAHELEGAGQDRDRPPASTNDNDGLWTCMYIGAEAFRYGVTGDPEAKKNARRSLEAMMFLERVSGIPGFAARSIVPIDGRSAEVSRRVAPLGRQSLVVEGRYLERRGGRPLLCLRDLLRRGGRRARRKKKSGPTSSASRTTFSITALYYIGPPGKPTTWGIWGRETESRPAPLRRSRAQLAGDPVAPESGRAHRRQTALHGNDQGT